MGTIVQLKALVSVTPSTVLEKADPKSVGFGKTGSCFKQD